MTITLPPPQLQIDFAFALEEIRERYLHDALRSTVARLNIATIDAELAHFVSNEHLSKLASHSLRGEVMFAVPSVLTANPYLLGYYRLLLGFSQKSFYTSDTGLSPFKRMEERGIITTGASKRIEELCSTINSCGALLLDGIGARRITNRLLEELALLTVGPQLRGGQNVKAGLAAIVRVFEEIKSIVEHNATDIQPKHITLTNAAGRTVHIEFAPDPDIIIREQMTAKEYRNIIAIEVKGGLDFSNVHNRIGEAEKSHQKARSNGYHECWTVVNVDRVDVAMARRESPSTNRFYRLSQIENKTTDEYHDFFHRIVSLTGIQGTAPSKNS